MVGYANPCPCCGGTKRRRGVPVDRSESLPLRRSPALPPAKIPRSASDPTPCSSAAPALHLLDPKNSDWKADDPAAAALLPEHEPEKDAEMVQESEAKDSAATAIEHKQCHPPPPTSTGEEAEVQEPETKDSAAKLTEHKQSPPAPPASTGDEGEIVQEQEPTESAKKASGEVVKTRPEMTAEVRIAEKGVHVSISFRCKCSACFQEVNLA